MLCVTLLLRVFFDGLVPILVGRTHVLDVIQVVLSIGCLTYHVLVRQHHLRSLN